jgi:hypothetical protein
LVRGVALNPTEIHADIEKLVETWCDRRCYKALAIILGPWPLVSGLTDSWYDLLKALKDIRAFAKEELLESEDRAVHVMVNQIEKALKPRI